MPDTYDHTDLTGSDFRGSDLSGKSLAHSILTGCRFGRCVGVNFNCCTGDNIEFRGADVSDTFLEQTADSVLRCLPGAFWHGVEITHVSGWITSSGLYWCFANNAFVQIGCMQKTLAEWQQIGQDLETLRVLHDEQPKINLEATLAWWKQHSPAIIAAVNSLTA